MDEDKLNMSVRKFLKQVGVTSQREIETAVREGLEAGKLSAGSKVSVKVTLEMPDTGTQHTVEGVIET